MSSVYLALIPNYEQLMICGALPTQTVLRLQTDWVKAIAPDSIIRSI
jgi:hypothetical protein